MLIRSLYERLRDSLFALPATIVALLGLASWGARRVDAWIPDDLPWLLPTTVDSTRAILSTVATATITVAGIVFSMTAVVVQLATSQLSPRVTQGFLRDPFQQATIGFTVGTFVYSLLSLANVQDSDRLPFSNQDFTATLAVILGVTSMIFIVLFIDRTMRNMRIDTVIRRLADSVESSFRSLPHRRPAEDPVTPIPEVEAGSVVRVQRTGWVADVNWGRVLGAIPDETLVRVDLRVGDFITEGEIAARTWPEVDAKAQHEIAAAVTVARTRSVANDPAYGIRQMVDIGLRALSPSLNDPTTGSDLVRHLGGPMQVLLLRDLPGRVIADDGGKRIYLPRAMTYSDYVHEAFREIRLHAGGQPYVLHALVETLASLIAVVEAAELEGRTAALVKEAEETLKLTRESDMPDFDKAHVLDFARRLGLEEAAQ
ncbi:MAG: DUF2254 domain-containing protein [Actinomycetota bacterium]